MKAMLERVKKAAIKVHPGCEVFVTHGIVEVLLPEDAGLLWHATEGTMLVADEERFDGIAGALRATLDDIKAGAYAEVRS